MDTLKRIEDAATAFILDPSNHDLLTLVKGIRNGIVYGTKVRFPHALVYVPAFASISANAAQHDLPLPLRNVSAHAPPSSGPPANLPRIRHKLLQVLKATRQHARNLGLFSLIYKGTMLLLRRAGPAPDAKAGPGQQQQHRSADPFLAGLLAGYLVFGRSRSAVAQQIVTYVFARAAIGLAKLAFASATSASASTSAAGVRLGGAGAGAGAAAGGDAVRELVARNAWPVFASVSWAAVMWLFVWHPEVVQPSMRSSMTYMCVFATFGLRLLTGADIRIRIIGTRLEVSFGIINRTNDAFTV
jgi:peroxisomal membrane protein 4